MSARREILDSEDEGSVYGEDSELPDTAPQDDTHQSRSVSSDSTDPFSFQRIDDEQHAAADKQSVVSDTAPAAADTSICTDMSSAPPPGQKPPPESFSSLTPITDPVPASRRAKRGHEGAPTDMIDLTNITTPRKETATGANDVWDVPASARSQMITRTYGQRRRAAQQLSLQQEPPSGLAPTQDPYDFPEATPPSKKRKKTGRSSPSSSPQPAQDSSPVMLVPTDDVASSDRRTRRSRGRNNASRPGSSTADAGTSLFIAQSSLTASQKQEYRMVSLSSEAGYEVPDTSLPMPNFGEGGTYKSSGTTTIAYPTPSRVAFPRSVPSDEADEGGVSAAAPGGDIQYPQSSPDILTDMSATNTGRSKRIKRRVVASENLASPEIVPPMSTRQGRKRKAFQEEGGDGNSTAVSSAQENGEFSLEEVGGGEVAGHADGRASAAPESESPVAPTSKSTQKKRPGRPKKGAKSKEPAPPANADPEPIVEPAEVAEPAAKRKRGRPRKSEANEPTSADKPAADSTKEVEHESADKAATPQPLSEVPRNSQTSVPPKDPNPAADADRDGSDDSKENDSRGLPSAVSEAAAGKGVDDDNNKAANSRKEKEKEKEAEIQTGVAAYKTTPKVHYRVGLSRRSRIAPLLKSLKKAT
ncbi:hypothetical protein VTK26DRAFT_5517 [Humicola hyalothermophila]